MRFCQIIQFCCGKRGISLPDSPRAGADSTPFVLLVATDQSVSRLPVSAGMTACSGGAVSAGASIVTINQSTPENGAALVAVTIRTDTMQMTPEELTEKLSRQRMVVGVHCGYNL